MAEDKKQASQAAGLATNGSGLPDPAAELAADAKPKGAENGAATAPGVKKLGALVDYNDSDSDEGKLEGTE
jgi:hypothetical protein